MTKSLRRSLSLLTCTLTCIPFLAQAADERPITNQQISEEATRIAASTAQEPPVMALDTLLRTATLIRPYLEQDAQRIFSLAAAHTAKNPDMAIGYTAARLWMDLDPTGGESEMRKFTNRRHVLQILSAYYTRKDPDHSIDLAVEALQIDPERKSETPGLMETVAAQRPLLAVELLQLPHIVRDTQYPLTFINALEGLHRAALTKPAEVNKAADLLEPIVRRADFANGATTIVSIWRNGEKRSEATDSRPALLEMLNLARQLADEKTRSAAQAVVRNQSTNFSTKSGGRPPVDGNLPLDRAIAEIRKREPAYQQLGDLWVYLQGRKRPVDEDRAILTTLIEWAMSEPTRADPAWFVQSLLNLDGRLGPPGRAWQLAPELRPMVFIGAARASQRMDRTPDQLNELALAMAAEKVPVPAELALVRNRIALDDLRNRLELRYNFTLPALDKTATDLQGLRGKAVVLSFWATWCGPCRAELLILERLSKEFGKDLQVLAITNEAADKINGFLATNPLALRVLMDQRQDVFNHYVKATAGIPQSFVIGRNGLRLKDFHGVAKEDDLRSAIRSALR